MKIVITGGAGFIFSHVAEYFLNKGWDVTVLDNLSAGSNREVMKELKKNPRFNFVIVDVSHLPVIELVSRMNPDYIVHAAAISDVDYSIKFPHKTIHSNLLGNLNIFEAARKCSNLKKLLYVSTDEIYGECEHQKHEEELLFPKNPYAVSKAMGSILRLAYDNTYRELKNKTVETRFCNVFGPRQDKRKIMGAIKEALAGRHVIPIHEEGRGYREYIYVKNIPPVIELLLEKGDRTYNVTTNDGFSVAELIKKVSEITSKNIQCTKGNRPGMDLKYQMDNDRLLELGWIPRYSFEEGLKEYLNA